jgi:hypothetical protein
VYLDLEGPRSFNTARPQRHLRQLGRIPALPIWLFTATRPSASAMRSSVRPDTVVPSGSASVSVPRLRFVPTRPPAALAMSGKRPDALNVELEIADPRSR